MIRRPTVVYIMVLLAVTAVYLYFDRRQQPAAPEMTPEPTASYLFQANAGTPVSIRIKAKTGETVELARNSEAAWALRLPVKAGAEQGSSEAAASQVLTMRILDKTPKIDLALVGLKDPEYILTVKFKNGTERTVKIGVVTPTESGYYAQEIIRRRCLDLEQKLRRRPARAPGRSSLPGRLPPQALPCWKSVRPYLRQLQHHNLT